MQKPYVLIDALKIYLAKMDTCEEDEWACVEDNIALAKEAMELLQQYTDRNTTASSTDMQLILH